MRPFSLRSLWPLCVLLAAFAVTTAVYWPGLYGGFLFDDYPNIVDNHGVQIRDASVPSLTRAALSSPSSEFKRPLASLSFAANYLATGLDPYWMKLTNLLIHLLNGLLVFFLTRLLLRSADPCSFAGADGWTSSPTAGVTRRIGVVAALVAGAWMLLPINLTGVLYVVQRMESMANAFVLLGLIGYVASRRYMLAPMPAPGAAADPASPAAGDEPRLEHRPPARDSLRSRAVSHRGRNGFIGCVVSIILPTAIGVLAKETAVMLPLYAVLTEWALFRFSSVPRCAAPHLPADMAPHQDAAAAPARVDRRLIGLFGLVLVLPIIVGLAWLLPGLLRASAWATRDFTMGTRLLSEARIVADYIVWTLLPTPPALSFYHDDFNVSTGLFSPWTTLGSMLVLAALVAFALWIRRRRPLVALGIALFLGCQLLTGTILPLELIYEHRNYFASYGLLLAIVPLLAAPPPRGWSLSALVRSHGDTPPAAAPPSPTTLHTQVGPAAVAGSQHTAGTATYLDQDVQTSADTDAQALPMALPRYVLLGGLLLFWTALTGVTSYAWGNPLLLAEDLAQRAPDSPRAQYELGRTYIIYSHYDPASPFTRLAYAPLERSAALPDSSILPEQALIFMNARMHLPLKDAWWDSMIAKLKAHPLGVQDESSLSALTQCARSGGCDLPKARMMEAFMAALSHPRPGPRLLATYGDYAWNVLDDHALGLRMTEDAVKTSPDEPAYQITLIRMLVVQGRIEEARQALQRLATLNIGGRLNGSLDELRHLIDQG